MADLCVIVPSRGRPEAARTLIQAFKATCTADTFLAFAVDDSDPAKDEYAAACDGILSGTLILPSATMVEALNLAAVHLPQHHGAFAVGFMGDDHLPRTVGWDERYLAVLRDLGTGIVFGNDLLQGHRLPTQCAMTADIVGALGYMCPPALRHLYVDNTWLVWGNSVNRLRYLPDVTIEHRHPLAGKSSWDEGYLRVNSDETAEHDRLAYEAYLGEGLHADLAKLQALLVVAA